MKRLVVALGLVMSVAGCAPHPIIHRGPAPESRYLEGFMDGYYSAHPDQPYAKAEGVYLSPGTFDPRDRAYRQGWKAGYQTGRKDTEQRE